MTRRSTDYEAIEAEIDRIRSLGLDDLRMLWRTTFRSSPPLAFTKDLMTRFFCWHIQEQAHGGVDANTGKLLDGLARGDKPAADRRLKPGTVLVREYQGDRHTVTVVPGGYVWRDATYASSRPLPATSPARPGTAHVSLGYALAAIVLKLSKVSQRKAMLALPPMGDCIVAGARHRMVPLHPAFARRRQDNDAYRRGHATGASERSSPTYSWLGDGTARSPMAIKILWICREFGPSQSVFAVRVGKIRIHAGSASVGPSLVNNPGYLAQLRVSCGVR